jgi:hypothetical protein
MIIARMSLIALLGFALQTAHAQESVSPIPNEVQRLFQFFRESPTQVPARACVGIGRGEWTAGGITCSCEQRQCYKNCRKVLIDGEQKEICDQDGGPQCEKGTGSCTVKF